MKKIQDYDDSYKLGLLCNAVLFAAAVLVTLIIPDAREGLILLMPVFSGAAGLLLGVLFLYLKNQKRAS